MISIGILFLDAFEVTHMLIEHCLERIALESFIVTFDTALPGVKARVELPHPFRQNILNRDRKHLPL